MPKYEALSYVWGVERNPDPVMIKSQQSEQTFVEVTKNLATALVYLRYATEPRLLWIDALCINQEDLEQRSSQVGRMVDIYYLADRVVVWLGPESEEDRSTEAISTLCHIGSQIEIDWATAEMRVADQGDPSLVDLDVPLDLDQRQLDPVLKLLSRPWFERVWVQQEIAVANDNTVLICGHDCIMRWLFINAVFCLRLKPRVDKLDQESLWANRLMLMKTMAFGVYRPSELPYADTLREHTRSLKCSDPR